MSTAADLGATPIAGGAGLLERVLEITNGEGMPVVMEATGAVAAMEQTIDLVAAGGRIVILGLVKKGTGITFPGLDFTRKEVTILGSRASVDCFPEALDLLASGKIHYPKIASSFALGEAPAVFAKLADNPMALHKAVFIPEARMKLVTFSHRTGGRSPRRRAGGRSGRLPDRSRHRRKRAGDRRRAARRRSTRFAPASPRRRATRWPI